VFQKFITSLNGFSGRLNSIVAGIGDKGTFKPVQLGFHQTGDTGALSVHQQITDLASMRIGMEHDLIQAQRSQTMLEMDRMGQMADLLNQMYRVQGSGVMSMEGAFAKVYELRGRYGSAGFRRETL